MNLDTPSLNKKNKSSERNEETKLNRASKGEHPRAVKITVEDVYGQKIEFGSNR